MLSLKATDSVTAEEAQRWKAVAFPDDAGSVPGPSCWFTIIFNAGSRGSSDLF